MLEIVNIALLSVFFTAIICMLFIGGVKAAIVISEYLENKF